MSVGAGCRREKERKREIECARPTVTPTEPDFGMSRRQPCVFARDLRSSMSCFRYSKHAHREHYCITLEDVAVSPTRLRAFQRHVSRRRMTGRTEYLQNNRDGNRGSRYTTARYLSLFLSNRDIRSAQLRKIYVALPGFACSCSPLKCVFAFARLA